MKSLSILILLGTLTALIIGGIFAVSPVLAESQPQTASEALDNSAVAEVAPVTGSPAAIDPDPAAAPVVDLATDNPGTVLSSTFSVGFAKDWAARDVQLEAEAKQIAAQADATVNFDNFIATVSNGKANQVTGIYAEGVLAYSVRRQPAGNLGYVSEGANDVTEFALAAQYGTQGFLAHNYLAGASFSQLSVGQIVTLVYGDGSTASFRIDVIRRYQALSPNSTQSRFVDLETGKELSASDVFFAVYNGESAVVLQTCIAKDGIGSWGRLFVQASPISSATESATLDAEGTAN